MYQQTIHKKLGIIFGLLLLMPILTLSAPNPTIKYKVLGITDPALSNVNNRLKITERQLYSQNPENFLSNLQKQIPSAVQSALQPYGYYHAQVQVTDSSTQKKHHLFTIHVTPGKPVIIKQVQMSVIGPGSAIYPFQQYLKTQPLKQGAPLNTVDYQKVKKDFYTIAYNHGYLKAKYRTSAIYVDRKSLTATIKLVLDTGPQFFFGPVTFNQNLFDPNFLQRYVQFKPGEPYSTEKLMQLNKNLNSTNYFNNVSVHPKEKELDGTMVPITVNLTPSKAQKYTFGLGYGTDTGPRGQVGINLRHLTATGQHFESFLQVSQIESNLNAHYYFPGKNPVTDQSFIGLTFGTETPNTSKGSTAAFTLGHQTVWDTWKTTLSIGYQFDDYSLRGLPYRQTNLVLPQLSLQKSHFDDILFPRKGSQLSFEVRGSSTAIGSTSFIQGIMHGNLITSPSSNSRLLLRTTLGITGVDNLERVPLSLQLFAGGSQSIRGYDYKELGPGRYLYVGSVEFQHKVYKDFWGTVFVDAGNSVNNLRHPEQDLIGRPDKLAKVHKTDIAKVGAGVGAMYVSPIGPLELTFANPLTDRQNGWTVQFTMGTNL